MMFVTFNTHTGNHFTFGAEARRSLLKRFGMKKDKIGIRIDVQSKTIDFIPFESELQIFHDHDFVIRYSQATASLPAMIYMRDTLMIRGGRLRLRETEEGLRHCYGEPRVELEKPVLTDEMVAWFFGNLEEGHSEIKKRPHIIDRIIAIWGLRKEILDNDPREEEAKMNLGYNQKRDRCVGCGKLTFSSTRYAGGVPNPGVHCFVCRDIMEKKFKEENQNG